MILRNTLFKLERMEQDRKYLAAVSAGQQRKSLTTPNRDNIFRFLQNH